jgi:hypothetical protein
MDTPRPDLPTLTQEERTPIVDALLELLAWQSKRIEELEQEILKLKGETTKPNIKPSKMDNPVDNQEGDQSDHKNSGRGKGPKKNRQSLRIDETVPIHPENIPPGSRFKGYRDVVIQDLILKAHNTCYRLAEYQTPDGHYVTGQLPQALKGCHFGKDLIAFILYQYHHQHVTQPLLLQQLHDLDIQISSGSLNKLITENLEVFHQEKDALLEVGIKLSSYVQTDDTSARHNGKNGYCTYIGNDLFSWFASTESKSRINFLSLLKQGIDADYVLNAGALECMARQNLPKNLLERLEPLRVVFKERNDWDVWLNTENIMAERHRRIITEGALMGGLLAQGIPADFGIVSDDAGQFNVFDHVLCWIHAERAINRLLPMNDLQKQAVAQVREKVWSIYRQLKAYKLQPQAELAQAIRQQFTQLTETKTCYASLNQALKQFSKNRHELLRVLDKPYLPLHNNLSERDIREYVRKRKISSSTRSEAGRRCRDTFASLKKTCRKQGISFWAYLKARLLGDNSFLPLTDLLHAAVAG